MSEKIVKRQGSVQNSGSVTIETGNTTGNNYRTESHISGTSKSTLNDGSVNDLIVGTKSEIIGNDLFKETKGNDNQHVAGSKVTSVLGDVFFRFGNLDPQPFVEEKKILESIDEVKSLFEVKRTDGGGVFNALDQSKSGNEEPCRECSQGKKRDAYDDEDGKSLTDQLQNLPSIDLSMIGFISSVIPTLSLSGIATKLKQFPQKSDCNACGGKGVSRSSEKGEYQPDERKEQVGQMYVDSAPSLTQAEQQMGEGGNFVTEVSKNVVFSIGTIFNNLNSVRTDPKGKLIQTGFAVDKKGLYPTDDASPLIEPKHVDDLSGGTLTLIANNKAAFFVGAGGLKIQSAGINEIYGSITNITGDQVNISSSNEVNLGGSRLNIEAKALSLKSSGGQLVVDSNLAINSNLMVQGGAMFKGPIFCNGIVGPLSYQVTEELLEAYATTNDKISKIIGYWLKGLEISFDATMESGDTAIVVADDGSPDKGKPIPNTSFKIKLKPTIDIQIKTC